jgi:S1-C subfamily serine protease
MPNPTPPDLPKWQAWIARVVPILYVTILTLLLPRILIPAGNMAELDAQQQQKLQQQIRSISIKVLAHGQTIGSGILFSRSDDVYTVATNAHVIQSASAPFQLQTADGQIYAAALVPPPLKQNRDLSILRFRSLDRTYLTAKLATIGSKIGDRVWASGFPLDPNTLSAQSAVAPLGLTIADGQITQILPIAISGGYNIGYDNPIRKGMSGGALVNRDGELVGMNGVHAEPLWNTTDLLENGTKVGEKLQEQINNSSWAIPSQFIKQYVGK